MTYSITFSRSALKQLKDLEKNDQARIISTLERYRIRPYENACKLVGCEYFRFRIGDYRIIVDIQQNALNILVIEIGHRGNIYKKFFSDQEEKYQGAITIEARRKRTSEKVVSTRP